MGALDLALLCADARSARTHYKFRLERRLENLPKTGEGLILYGSDEEPIRFSYDDGMRGYDVNKPFEGVVKNLERRYLETESEWAREEIEPL